MHISFLNSNTSKNKVSIKVKIEWGYTKFKEKRNKSTIIINYLNIFISTYSFLTYLKKTIT